MDLQFFRRWFRESEPRLFFYAKKVKNEKILKKEEIISGHYILCCEKCHVQMLRKRTVGKSPTFPPPRYKCRIY